MQKLLIFTLSIASLALSGCSVYHLDIQQGNVIEPKQLALLQPGMDKKKVQFIMGTPLLRDPFHPNRWDYVYTMERNGQPRREQRVTLIFDGDRLVHIDKHLNPAVKPPQDVVDTESSGESGGDATGGADHDSDAD